MPNSKNLEEKNVVRDHTWQNSLQPLFHHSQHHWPENQGWETPLRFNKTENSNSQITTEINILKIRYMFYFRLIPK